MGQWDATLVLVRPEPDEGNSLVAVRLNGERHQFRAQGVDRLIDGPGGKLDRSSRSQMKLLKILADAHGKKRACCVICLSDQLLKRKGGSFRRDISLAHEVVEYF